MRFNLFKKIIIICLVSTSICIAYLFSPPRNIKDINRNIGNNGIWVGHKWYTGFNVGDKKPVSQKEMAEFISTLNKNEIKYVYIHSGPLNIDGTINDMPGEFFQNLKIQAPDVIFLPWIGGHRERLKLHEDEWVSVFLQTVSKLHERGFDGIHLDIEPIRDNDIAYINLLKRLKSQWDGKLFISHATRRLSPNGTDMSLFDKNFWSINFYRQTMLYSDQTVLMGYDTCLKFSKLYIAYMKHQTKLLLSNSVTFNNHKVLIGIPAYEDVSKLSDPNIENIKNAVIGVKLGLSELSENELSKFEGVSIYANWVTDDEEWDQYEDYWLK